MKYLFPLALLALTGCHGTTKIGTVNGVEYHAVRQTDLFGPSVVQLVRVDADGTVTDLNAASSAGLGPALIGAGGDIAASRARRPDETNVDIGDRQYLTPARP
jgi:hypothetical protein